MRSIRMSEREAKSLIAENERLSKKLRHQTADAPTEGGPAPKKAATTKAPEKKAAKAPSASAKKVAADKQDKQALREDVEAAKRPSPGSSKKSEATSLPRVTTKKK